MPRLLDSAGPSRPPALVRPKSFADQLADARAYFWNSDIPKSSPPLCISANSTSGLRPRDSVSTAVKPSRLAPSASSLRGTKKATGKGKAAGTRSASTIKSPIVENGDARGRAVQSTAADPVRKSPSPGEGREARRRPDYDSSDHSDLPLAQKQAKIAPASTKSGKRTDTKDAPRPPPARKKRAAPKAKADTKRTAVAADDANGDEQTKRTQTSMTTEATAGREASANSRKRGAEEGHGHEDPPHGDEDVPDVLQPTKRARVLQEKKSAPLKRKELAKNVDDGNDAIRTADKENENAPPTKKRRRADPQTAIAVRYVGHPVSICASPPRARWLHPSFVFFSPHFFCGLLVLVAVVGLGRRTRTEWSKASQRARRLRVR
jgi:hypothetical protein